ncbi:MAG TPA: DUF6265 family protein [Candidatus Acidoferrales bacterium]
MSISSPAQQPAGAGSQPTLPTVEIPQTPASNVKPASLAELSWLQGQWSGTWGPRTATEIWSAPRAGVLLGTLQIAENDKTTDVEFFMIRQAKSAIEYRLLHFTPSLTAWAPATLFLASTDSKRFVFQNQSDGQPHQLALTHTDADTYTSHWEIAHETGDPLTYDITFHRQKLSAGNAAHR